MNPPHPRLTHPLFNALKQPLQITPAKPSPPLRITPDYSGNTSEKSGVIRSNPQQSAAKFAPRLAPPRPPPAGRPNPVLQTHQRHRPVGYGSLRKGTVGYGRLPPTESRLQAQKWMARPPTASAAEAVTLLAISWTCCSHIPTPLIAPAAFIYSRPGFICSSAQPLFAHGQMLAAQAMPLSAPGHPLVAPAAPGLRIFAALR